MASGPNNKEISALLGAIADALEIKAQDEFRARAFRIGARRVETVDVEVAGAVLENRLDALPGIGDTMGKVIAEFVQTGASTELAEARAGIPDGVFEILAIQGIGPKTASRLFNELEIVDVDGLEAAAQSGRLRELSGMGPKKVQTYLREIERLRERRGSFRLGQALPEGLALLAALGEAGGLTAANPAGEMRRGCPTVRCIELVVASDDTEATARTFSGLCQVTESGPALARGATKSGIPVVLHLTTPDDFAVTLIRHSGSATHLEKITAIANAQRIRLGETGPLTRASGEAVRLANEEAFFDLLGLQFIPAELREDRGEIEAAQQAQLPRLVEIGDIRGDLHTHTRWSDGAHTTREMAAAAQRLGHAYLIVSDHSQSLVVAQGLEPERLREQALEVAAVNEDSPNLAVLHGSEVDILSGGTLDYEDSDLARLDWVTASVHTAFQQSSKVMTERILAAVRHPWSDSIGHPTGRLLNVRNGYEFETAAVFTAAAETGTAMEINAMPDRLDLSDELARRAVDMGVEIVINTDAHVTEHLGLLPYGIMTARRAGITREQVVNALDLDDLREWRRARLERAGV